MVTYYYHRYTTYRTYIILTITDKDIVIKVTGNSTINKFTYIPSHIRRKNTCELIEKSNLFTHLDNTLWAYNLYGLKFTVMRQLKIDKITKNKDIPNRLAELMDTIKNDIELIELYNGDKLTR